MKRIALLSAALWTSLSAGEPSGVEISIVGGMIFPESDTRLDDQMAIGGEIQYNTDFFLRPELQFLQSMKTDFTRPTPSGNGSTNLTRIGLNAVYDFNKGHELVPFVKAGIGYETLNHHDFENEDSLYTNAGLGIKYFLTENIAVKAEGFYLQKLNEPYYDANFGVLGGLTIAFGGGETIEPVPEQEPKIQPKPAAKPKVKTDLDHDGVFDINDSCPDTPAEAAVGKDVEISGNTIRTYGDGDGIADYLDICPKTPAGIATGPNGCPLDSDGDDVPDDKDRCANTSAGVQVDAKGCPRDRDGDGIPDGKDKCPNSAKGAAVDLKGCELPPVLHIAFGNNAATIPAGDAAKIKAYARFLKRNHFGVVVIGHTDSIGSDANNRKLSEKRAKAVAKIIEAEGVPAKRIKTVGKGESDPIADNSTEEGRAKNRRIEFKRVP